MFDSPPSTQGCDSIGWAVMLGNGDGVTRELREREKAQNLLDRNSDILPLPPIPVPFFFNQWSGLLGYRSGRIVGDGIVGMEFKAGPEIVGYARRGNGCRSTREWRQ